MRWVFALVQAVGLAGLLTIDALSRKLTETSVAARDFILSDAFWPTLFGGIAAALGAMVVLLFLSTFLPSRSGRTGRERDA